MATENPATNQESSHASKISGVHSKSLKLYIYLRTLTLRFLAKLLFFSFITRWETYVLAKVYDTPKAGSGITRRHHFIFWHPWLPLHSSQYPDDKGSHNKFTLLVLAMGLGAARQSAHYSESNVVFWQNQKWCPTFQVYTGGVIIVAPFSHLRLKTVVSSPRFKLELSLSVWLRKRPVHLEVLDPSLYRINAYLI